MNSSLSFHCVICFEEFDSHTIYPVVLPCGHTYVCAVCANRINKCMECRTSLFTEVSAPSPELIGRPVDSPQTLTYRYGRRSSRDSQQVTPPPKKTRERIPLPKNLVLISLIESSNLMQKSNNNRLLSKLSYEDISSHGDEDEEEIRISLGSNIANAASGTYAVAAKDGLKIVPHKKKSRGFASTALSAWHQDSWVNNVEHVVNNNPDTDESHSKNPELMLNYGDRIQVVSIVNKWAKLARGYGYVYCEHDSDLVKVGDMLDKAAKLEALINGLSNCRNKLIEAKTTAEADAIGLMGKLQAALRSEEDMTVIGAEAFEAEESADVRDDDLSAEFSLSKLENLSGEGEEFELSTHQLYMEREAAEKRKRDINNSNHSTFSFLDFVLCNPMSSLLGGETSSCTDTHEQRDDLRSTHERTLAQMNMDARRSQRQLARAAQEWRNRNGVGASSLRTGRSGHQGLLSYHAHEHGHQNVGTLPKVSDHCGLTPRKQRVKKRSTDSYASTYSSNYSFG